MPDFLLPDLGEGLDEAEVIAWRVEPGDRVAVDQVIAEVETAKAVVEVPVPYAGVVAALHVEPGSTVSVGQPLITVTTDDAATRRARRPASVEPGRPIHGGAADSSDSEEASGSVLIGYGTRPRPPAAGAAAAAARPAHRRRALPDAAGLAAPSTEQPRTTRARSAARPPQPTGTAGSR